LTSRSTKGQRHEAGGPIRAAGEQAEILCAQVRGINLGQERRGRRRPGRRRRGRLHRWASMFRQTVRQLPQTAPLRWTCRRIQLRSRRGRPRPGAVRRTSSSQLPFRKPRSIRFIRTGTRRSHKTMEPSVRPIIPAKSRNSWKGGAIPSNVWLNAPCDFPKFPF